MTNPSDSDDLDHNDPLRVGRGLVTGGADPAERTVTSAGQIERDVDEPDVASERRASAGRNTSLAHPGLEVGVMEDGDAADSAAGPESPADPSTAGGPRGQE